MPDFLRQLFSSGGFMPHGHCYLWNSDLIWLHVVSDALIALAYTSIPFTLLHIMRKRRDLPFNWMFACFGVFIIACGATHVMEIWTLWTPTYWLAGVIKAITAVASVSTAILLVRLVPAALALPTPTQLARAHADLELANEALEKRVSERERSEEELRRAKERAENASRELEAFSYSVAHDLRAPLRALSGFSGALVEDYESKLDATGKDYLVRIGDAAERMSKLIDALLSLSKVSRVELRRDTVNLANVVDSVVAQLRQSQSTRNVDVVCRGELVSKGDPVLLHLLMENLLGNAWKFTSNIASPRIEIGSEPGSDGFPAFYVRDNGAGFDMTYADKLFAPFQRLHAASEFPGTGIGLATVQRIVGRHGGRIWADAEVGKGATFRFTLAEPTAKLDDATKT